MGRLLIVRFLCYICYIQVIVINLYLSISSSFYGCYFLTLSMTCSLFNLVAFRYFDLLFFS